MHTCKGGRDVFFTKFCKILFVLFFSITVFNSDLFAQINSSSFRSTEEILGQSSTRRSAIEKIAENSNTYKTVDELFQEQYSKKPTNCASKLFSQALIDHANEIKESDDEYLVQLWAKTTMLNPTVLKQVLQCPEITSIKETDTIFFTPVVYTFPGGRKITINYSAQPKVLKHHVMLAEKPSLPTDDPNPNVMNLDDPAKYINTEPAWYAIMVVQHDSLSNFVGPDKNNTVSMKYIDANIDQLYPRGYHCTSRSAWANDDDTINQVVHKVVDIEKDSNDYYVAGDINLEWVMYAEIAAEVIITVVTWGGGALLSGGLKSLRATRAGEKLLKTTRALSKTKEVQKYLRYSYNLKKAQKELKLAKTAKDAAKIAKMEKKVQGLSRAVKGLEKGEKVVQYTKNFKALTTVMNTRRALRTLRSFKRLKRGNILAKMFKSYRGIRKGEKAMNAATRVARAGLSSRSARIGDWLMNTTLKFGSRLARFTSKAGFAYGFLTFMGDMFDQTSNTSKEFTNGIEFKPFCLLSADDIKGQENVVNYGMWLMWHGSSVDSADDDAAYLLASDFAEKFAHQLEEFQETHGAQCNVDIYVVRPIIRIDETNIEQPKGDLFYLVMNDVPWTTAKQFESMVPDKNSWDAEQQRLEIADPKSKYQKPDETASENAGNKNTSADTEQPQSDNPYAENDADIKEYLESVGYSEADLQEKFDDDFNVFDDLDTEDTPE